MQATKSPNVIKRLFIFGLGAGGMCVAIVSLVQLLYLGSEGEQQNDIHDLVSFLVLALPGILTSLLLALWARNRMPKHAVLLAWGSAALLAVILPAPCIVFNGWSDTLILWYLAGTWIAGALYGSSYKKTIKDQPLNIDAESKSDDA